MQYNKMQSEWKIRKDFNLMFSGKEKAIEDLCQMSVSINGKRYRDVLLDLSKEHYKLVEIFLTEVSKKLIKVNDRNWLERFKELAKTDKTVVKKKKPQNIDTKIEELIKKRQKENQKVDSDEDIEDKIEESLDSEEFVL